MIIYTASGVFTSPSPFFSLLFFFFSFSRFLILLTSQVPMGDIYICNLLRVVQVKLAQRG
jgi:hypothetical protein